MILDLGESTGDVQQLIISIYFNFNTTGTR